MKQSASTCAVALVLAFAPIDAIAQLRPLEPIPWRMLDFTGALGMELGASRLDGQRASLAGVSGKLIEVGNFSIAWKTGRVVLEAAGTAQRRFRDGERFTAPYPEVDPGESGRRNDSGDYRLSTTVRLSPQSSAAVAALRFGTRLPTTDNTTGLDRDAIDFFATAGFAIEPGQLSLSAEGGVGIHSTREPRFEQDDLFLYAVRAELRNVALTPSAAILGQLHGTTHSAIRGVENLGELRLGLRAGSRTWVRAEFVRGYERFSPSQGVIITAGLMR